MSRTREVARPGNDDPTPVREAARALPCGALDCLAFPSEAAAFERVLQENPQILAVGETHALKDTTVPSATVRFKDKLLPLLGGRAKSLVVELLLPDPTCRPVTEGVKRKQEAVTETQRATDQSDFVALGHAAKALGIEPFILRPSCSEYQTILDAGDDAISTMLALIAKLTEKRLRELHGQTEGGAPRIELAYGGALHNNLEPKPGFEAWSFGPALRELVGERYVELDLIVPEFVKDTDVWRALPWYAAYDPERYPDRTRLLRVAPQSYVLIFPRSPASKASE